MTRRAEKGGAAVTGKGGGGGDEVTCEWCGLEPATTRIIATDACASCAAATPRERVRRALSRWARGKFVAASVPRP
jgi:hypothetical protein